MFIIAHRGINKSQNQYSESGYQTFVACLKRGWGVEFDVNFTKDNKVVVWHDNDLRRLTKSRDKRRVAKITAVDFKEIKISGGRTCTLTEVLTLIIKSRAVSNALHLKGQWQTKKYLDILISELSKQPRCFKKIIIFDIKPGAASYLKKKLPKLILAASLAHPFDIRRFNKLTGGTLLSVKQAIKNTKLYDWVWLDEWDRLDAKSAKIFYNEDNFKILRKNNFKIAVVAPELHSNEKHPDSKNKLAWNLRMKQIINLKADAICTDYPEEVRQMI